MTLPFLKTPIGEQPVIIEGFFRATPEHAFNAWTQKDQMIKWFGPAPDKLERIDIDLKVGGSWCMTYKSDEEAQDKLFGTYQDIQPNRHLCFSWIHERIYKDGKKETTATSTVSIDFEPTDTGVFIRLTHSAVDNQKGRLAVGKGWDKSFANLADWLQ